MKRLTFCILATGWFWSHAALACKLPPAFSLISAYPHAIASPRRISGDQSFTLPGTPVRKVDPKGDGVVCTVFRQKPELTLLAVTMFAQDADKNVGDPFEILIVDSATGAVRHRILEQAKVDAAGFMMAFYAFDNATYSTVPDAPMFGVVTARDRRMNGLVESVRTMTLYSYASGKPVPVLVQTRMRSIELPRRPEQEPATDIESRSMTPLASMHHGLNDLQVNVRHYLEIIGRDANGGSTVREQPIGSGSYVLQFDGAMYRESGAHAGPT